MKISVIAAWLHLVHGSSRIGRMHFTRGSYGWNRIILDKFAYLLAWTNLMFRRQLVFPDTHGQMSFTCLFFRDNCFRKGQHSTEQKRGWYQLFWAVLSLGNKLQFTMNVAVRSKKKCVQPWGKWYFPLKLRIELKKHFILKS